MYFTYLLHASVLPAATGSHHPVFFFLSSFGAFNSWSILFELCNYSTPASPGRSERAHSSKAPPLPLHSPSCSSILDVKQHRSHVSTPMHNQQVSRPKVRNRKRMRSAGTRGLECRWTSSADVGTSAEAQGFRPSSLFFCLTTTMI